jgi:hypothetical protein
MAERGVGLANDFREHSLRDFIAQEWGEQPDRQVGIGKAAHGADLGQAEFRPAVGNIKPAVSRQPGKHGVGKAECGRFPAGADIAHRHPSVVVTARRRAASL